MATRMTINGISTCTEAGTEKYERFQLGRRVILLCKTHIGRVPSRTGQVGHGKGREGGQPMNTAYQTLIVKFSEPIKVLDGIFDDAEAWGVDTLKGWIDDYESSRFTAINSHTAVITSEYNMECLMEWLKRNTPIAEITEC